METIYPNSKVEVAGHTDDSGAAAYNKDLSQRRAEAVAGVLVEKYGISDSRVSAKGFGESLPIADNNSAAGRSANRRVVANIEAVAK